VAEPSRAVSPASSDGEAAAVGSGTRTGTACLARLPTVLAWPEASGTRHGGLMALSPATFCMASTRRTDDQSLTIPELPTLDPGLTLFETDGQVRIPLQTVAVDHLLLEGGTAVWVGTGRHCTTDTLLDIAPDRRVLDRIDMARAFTPYQHTALIGALDAQVDDDTAVVVLPDVDAHYRDDVQGRDGREMLVRALAQLAAVAREHDVPVLYTRTADDAFAAPVATAARHTVTVRETAMGPHFCGDEFETLVYPLEDDWVQTTLAFWQEVLQARQPLHQTATTEVFARGTN